MGWTALTDGGNEGGVEGIVGEAEEHAGLADPRVPDQQQLEEQVVGFLRHGERLRPPPARPPPHPAAAPAPPLPAAARPAPLAEGGGGERRRRRRRRGGGGRRRKEAHKMASCRAPRARCCFSSRGGGGARPHNPAARLCSLRPGLCTAAAPQRRSVTAQAARRGRDVSMHARTDVRTHTSPTFPVSGHGLQAHDVTGEGRSRSREAEVPPPPSRDWLQVLYLFARTSRGDVSGATLRQGSGRGGVRPLLAGRGEADSALPGSPPWVSSAPPQRPLSAAQPVAPLPLRSCLPCGEPERFHDFFYHRGAEWQGWKGSSSPPPC